MSDDAEVQARVAMLAEAFRAKLPARFEKMNAAFALCTVDGAGEEHWIELHRLLHSLNGAAGTFGLAELGAQACAIEHTIKNKLASGEWLPGDLEQIGQSLQALQAPAGN